jgi:predicted AlkP superfamily pyrophosphatase or phosphodiesterase
MRFALMLLTILAGAACSPALLAAGKTHHVVVVVWDGMRPDFVSEQTTPTLCQLARHGVTFQNHHPVFPSTTEVNGATLFTGGYPDHDGILASREYRPDLDPLKSVYTEEFETVRRGDELSHSHYLHLPTIAEIVRQSGGTAVVAGSKPVALLADRAERQSADGGATVFAGSALPARLGDTITNLHGEFPMANSTNPTPNDWTIGALLDPLWRSGVPEFSLLWMNEPDLAQHETGPGSARSLAAIRNVDDNLARVLRALEAKGARDTTDLIVLSDHGSSTVSIMVDLADSMRKAGLEATREFKELPQPGEILVVGNSGSALIYVIDHDEKVIRQVVKFLQGWNYSGVIFTRKPLPGTFALDKMHLGAANAPDVVVSMRWTAEKNEAGASGMLVSDVSSYGVGQGAHASLSRFDMRSILIASGPDFRPGIVDALPSGSVDIAPTVLWLLGYKPPKLLDGRILSEALTLKGPKLLSFEPRHFEATCEQEKSVWHQYLNQTEVNGVTYYEEGNGCQTPK